MPAPATYEERVNRFRVLRRTNWDEATPDGREARASMRLHGIDPDDCWSLIWSFKALEDAEEQAAEERELWPEPRYTIRVKDAGEATTITRQMWF